LSANAFPSPFLGGDFRVSTGRPALLTFGMSNLYIRVMTGFYTHKKTVRLKIALGVDAYWIPPRLWAYAAENQPDGDLSGYTSEELAELIGCSKHTQAMLQALKNSGFIDKNGMIHDWDEHNGYHKSFSERAKKAAAARWAKEKPPTPLKEKETGNRKQDSGDKHCLTDACSIFEQIDLRAGSLFGRTSPTTIYSEQSAISEISRRPNVIDELAEIEVFHRKPENYFPQSLQKLLSTWQETLDRARTYENRKHQNSGGTNPRRPDRNKGTLNEGQSAKFAAFTERQKSANAKA
jgi:hypothetical protein